MTCGVPATFPGSCGLTSRKLDPLAAGECIELTDVRTSSDCPVSFGVPLSLSFEITASTTAQELRLAAPGPGGTTS